MTLPFGGRCVFESSERVLAERPDVEPQRFTETGFTLAVLEAGRPSGMYHAESYQEDFLVLSGTCMTGHRRQDRAIVYPRSEPARARGAGVETETTAPLEAYAPFPPWRLGRPDAWAALPWA